MNTTRALQACSTKRPSLLLQIRSVSTTKNAKSSVLSVSTVGSNNPHYPSPPAPKSQPPLAKLPLTTILRSLLILSVSSSPLLLRPCIYTLSTLAHPRSPWTDVSRNPVLNWLIKNTIYRQFNAGENKVEVQRSIEEIKKLGYRGVLLGYAREVLVGESATSPHDQGLAPQEVATWLKGTLDTVDMATEGDFIALKFTGMGTQALHLLQNRSPPSEDMDAAIRKACDAAVAKGARLLVDAEEQAVQPGIEDWIMRYQKYCNSKTPGRATLYGTYQAYLRSTPSTLAKHLAIAERDGYTFGVKLVRGAYLKTEARDRIWSTKAETDRCYDEITEALLTRQYNSMLTPAPGAMNLQVPPVNVIVATHNRESVQKAHALRLRQAQNGESRVELSYAQLQGMADEVSCELVNGFQDNAAKEDATQVLETANVYKLLTWGSIQECMGFLLRRAVENTEAVGRTKESQRAMAKELKRRCMMLLGFRG